MSPGRRTLLRKHLPDPSLFDNGEAKLMPALMRWLIATGRVRTRTAVAHEVPWLGRRVDLALLNGAGVTTAFELKIGRLQRVIEQAAYNKASFHRSWIVTGNKPKQQGLVWARELGVGLLVVRDDSVSALVRPASQEPQPEALQRLQATIAALVAG